MSAVVLVVEDDEMVAEVARVGLEAENFTVIHAPTPEAGVAAAAQQRPDLVLVGISRVDTGGWDAVTRMRQEPGVAQTPIIVLSPRMLPADRVRGDAVGVARYLEKPFTAAQLIQTVREALPAPS